ncbi:unnamed protein product [Clavelina lepadiformis]|uniref:UDP-N-acetylglucosamine transferase subunit ALG13 n=1 Tax=Clavelina lepadiformis TaxID=159417 RepID=A0ABP0H1D4_CLALP
MSVFVTVGTTSFETLIETVTSKLIVQTLRTLGYKNLTVQYGRGIYEVEEVSCSQFSVTGYRYKSSILDDIENADLVISHAGAGSCLEVLEARKPLIVVVNEKLMNNHQFELAKQFHQDGHLLYCTCSTLASTLKDMDLSSLKPLPPPKTSQCVLHIKEHFGLS